jgi:hypothetical protein
MQISKKLVSSDFKNNRVTDLKSISSKQERAVKKYVKEFFDKAVVKHREHEQQRAKREGKDLPVESNGANDEVKLTDDEADDDADLKRKRLSEGEKDALKKVRMEEHTTSTTIPTPPPPPPTQDLDMDLS